MWYQWPPVIEIIDSDVVSEGRYEHPKTPILGLVLNLSHFCHFVPESTGRIFMFPTYGYIYENRWVKEDQWYFWLFTRIVRNVCNFCQMSRIRYNYVHASCNILVLVYVRLYCKTENDNNNLQGICIFSTNIWALLL